MPDFNKNKKGIDKIIKIVYNKNRRSTDDGSFQ